MKGTSSLSFLILISILFWISDEHFLNSFLKLKTYSLENFFKNSFNKNLTKSLVIGAKGCSLLNDLRSCFIKEYLMVSFKNTNILTCTERHTQNIKPLALSSAYTCKNQSISASTLMEGNFIQDNVTIDQIVTVSATGYLFVKNLYLTSKEAILISHGDIDIDLISVGMNTKITLISTSGSITIKNINQNIFLSAFAKKITLPQGVQNQKQYPSSKLKSLLLSASPKDS